MKLNNRKMILTYLLLVGYKVDSDHSIQPVWEKKITT